MPRPLKRWMMRLNLMEQRIDKVRDTRPISLQDGPVLGELMYEAYHDTIDDEGETPKEALQEVENTLAGKYGPPLVACSFLIEEHGRVLGASVLTDWTNERTGKKQPLLSFLMTHPAAKGQGIATLLLKQSINALLAEGERELVLFVTVGNDAAQHIYQQLGFQVEEEFATSRIKPE